jgi:hypothetical protein
VAAARALLREVEALRPVEAGGRPVFRWDRAEYALFYTPGYLEVVGLGEAERFEKRIGAGSAHAGLGKAAGGVGGRAGQAATGSGF